jgi:hypothetical protein
VIDVHRHPAAPVKPRPRFQGDPMFGNGGRAFDEVEHLVPDDNPDVALCGIDQKDVPWDQGWPVCEACRAVAESRLS